MSDLTPCNWCTLQHMKRRAAKRGVEVVLAVRQMEHNEWITARYSDREEPSAMFLALSEGCVC